MPRKKPSSTTTARAAKRPAKKAARAKPKDAATLAAEQGVKPVEDFDKFLEEMGGVWPEDEDLEDFLAWLKEQRK